MCAVVSLRTIDCGEDSMSLVNPDLQGLDLSDYAVPGRGKGLLEVFRWRYLLRLLVRKETATRYRNSALGWLWSYVRPAAQFAIFYVVLGMFLQMNKGIENFALYLFSGIIVVNFFSEGFANGTRTLVDNAHLVRKIFLPRELFPVAAVIVSFVHFLPQMGVLLVVCAFFGWVPSVMSLLAILLGLLTLLVFTLGLGMLFGSVNVPFRDAQNFVELILLFATWASPVLYSWKMVARVAPEWLLNIYMVNPLTSVVQLFHYGFWAPVTDGAFESEFPAGLWSYAGIALLISVIVLVVGQSVFRALEPKFAQAL